jgi:RimJ/RimL family protein N-acetyltransferase
MNAATARRATPQLVDFDTGNYRLRTVTVADASQAWIDWIADPYSARMLNAPRKSLTIDELRAYIAGFNQIDNFIIGFFDQKDGRQIGFGSGELSDCRRFLRPSFLIGDAPHRNIGVIQEITLGFVGHIFERLPIEGMVGNVLPHNEVIMHLAKAYGWRHVETLTNARPKSDGTGYYDVLVYALSREDFEKATWPTRNAASKRA